MYVTTGKTIALTSWTFIGKVMSLVFNTLSRDVIAFFPKSKYLLIPRLQSPLAVILEPKKIKSVTASIFSFFHEVMKPDAKILVFWTLRFKPAFSFSSFSLIQRFFSFSSLSAITIVVAAIQSPNCVQLFATPCTAACRASLPLIISQILHKFMSIELVMPSNYLILYFPLLISSVFPSVRDFSNESAVHIR